MVTDAVPGVFARDEDHAEVFAVGRRRHIVEVRRPLMDVGAGEPEARLVDRGECRSAWQCPARLGRRPGSRNPEGLSEARVRGLRPGRFVVTERNGRGRARAQHLQIDRRGPWRPHWLHLQGGAGDDLLFRPAPGKKHDRKASAKKPPSKASRQRRDAPAESGQRISAERRLGQAACLIRDSNRNQRRNRLLRV